ncbi:MAG TPA: HAMP domain-containing sensor histidine kinase [Nitrososphaeraceae archaeon]|nr:HAMP domain-containing sensor histidine kinase [Nitrososphaeraceae archaeon]
MTYLGNSINIAGKNRFLTSNLMFYISEFLFQGNTKDSSTVNSAINQLESNILVLRQGGNSIAGIELKPLPEEFLDDWNKIYQKWISLKSIIANNIIKPDNEMANSEKSIDKVKKTSLLLEREALSLVDSSNILVTKLGNYLKSNSEYSLFIQQIFIILYIVVTAAFAFYIARKILKPILSLTSTIYELNGEKPNVVGQIKGKNHDIDDELSVLSNSFNHMVNYIKNIKKQDKLIKELEKAIDELKYKDQLKNDFINVAAHEMKNPVQPIIALTELLQKGGIDDIEKNKEFLQIIFRNSKRLKQLTDDILDIARIESGSFFLNKEKFNLKEMITDILKDYEQSIIQHKKNLKLFYESSETNQIIVEADRNRLSQVIHNLLNNAIKFTNEGSITVIVERKTGNNSNNYYDEILVSIKDTGTGIHPEILPILFTKFATKSKTGGTGLGLFISKKIIEMHGGKIWAINNNKIDREKGVGSTFTFSLPIKR